MLREPSIALAVAAAIVSIASVLLTLELDRQLLIGAASAVAGSIVAVIYSYFLIRVLQRIRERTRKRVFIAYNHKDSDFVLKLADDMRSIGVNPVVDRFELRVGDDIRGAVDKMIDTCDFFVFVASESTKDSPWAKNEVEQAVKRGKKILPVMLKQKALPESLSGVYYADFSASYEQGFEALARTFGKSGANKAMQRTGEDAGR